MKPLSPAPLTLRSLLTIYLPLAFSWLMMAAESPICAGFVNSLPDRHVQIAAVLVLFSVALFIESPVIDLLSTSTALARNRASFAAIRRFSVWLMAAAGAVHTLVALVPPLHDFVFRTLLSQSAEVAEATRVPMMIMIPWSPAIGWRRHVQGLLIRQGLTKPIGLGTGIRVISIFLVGLAGYLSGRLTGAEVAALALSFSVVAEAVYIHFAGRRVMHGLALVESGERVSHRELLAFHMPLTLSTMVMMVGMPLTSKALASAPDGVLAMNFWQVQMTLGFLLRTITFALPEVVIANWRPGPDARLLSRFCLGIGAGLSVLMVVLALTGADRWFFMAVARADADVAHGAHQAFLACSLLPVSAAATNYVKGVLGVMKVTSTRVWGTGASMVVLAASLGAGVALQWPGVTTAAFGVTASQVTEFVVLAAFARHHTGAAALLGKV